MDLHESLMEPLLVMRQWIPSECLQIGCLVAGSLFLTVNLVQQNHIGTINWLALRSGSQKRSIDKQGLSSALSWFHNLLSRLTIWYVGKLSHDVGGHLTEQNQHDLGKNFRVWKISSTCRWQRSTKVSFVKTHQCAIPILRWDSKILSIKRPGKRDESPVSQGCHKYSSTTFFAGTGHRIYITARMHWWRDTVQLLVYRMTEQQQNFINQCLYNHLIDRLQWCKRINPETVTLLRKQTMQDLW